MKIRLNTSRVRELLHQDQPIKELDNDQEIPIIKEQRTENEEDQPKDLNEIRTVIKIDQPAEEEQPQKEEKAEKIVPTKTSDAQNKKNDDEKPVQKKDLEEKREYLKAIKDFDFRIKENKEKIDMIVEKINNLSKDLDDLVSLYEIVSEQMNPFVGLSKVTKERIDTLEHYTEEIKELKERLEHIELTVGSVNEHKDAMIEIPDQKKEKKLIQKQNPNTFSYDTLIIEDVVCSDEELDTILDESIRTLLPLKNIEREINDFLNTIS
ncbi:MAG: flagella accessory protein C [Thermoplasmatota archaeon]